MTYLAVFIFGCVFASAYVEVGRRGERKRFTADLQVERQRVDGLLDRLHTRSVQEYRNLPTTAAAQPSTTGRWVHSDDGLQSVYVAEGLE